MGLCIVMTVLIDKLISLVIPPPKGFAIIDPYAIAGNHAQSDALKGVRWLSKYEAERKKSKALRWEPYTYWRRSAFVGQHINVGHDGLRKTIGGRSDRAALQIWMFGGSTLWGTGSRDRDTIPSIVQQELDGRGIEANVLNFGEAGYVSTQNVIALLEELKRRPKPDLVVFYDGVNDVFSALQAGVAGLPQNEGNRVLEFNSSREADKLMKIVSKRLFSVWSFRAHEPQEPDVGRLSLEAASTYAANLRVVRAIARDFDFHFVSVWQPTIFTKRYPSLSESAAVGVRQVAHRSLTALTTASVIEGQRANAGFLDLSGILDEERSSVYLDFCHVSGAGNRVIALAMVDFFRRRCEECLTVSRG